MQAVTDLSLEVTALHAVITLEVTDDGLNGLASFELPSFLRCDPFGLARFTIRTSGLSASTPR